MTKRLPLLCVLLVLWSCNRSPSPPPAPALTPQAQAPAPAATPPAPVPEAAPAPSRPVPPPPQRAQCSASPLREEPNAPRTPLPPPVEAMRRRIVAAAVACDYDTLVALSREKGEGFSFGFGAEKDLAAAWRQREKKGVPVLERLVRVLNMPHAQMETLSVWPSVHAPDAPAEDWQALEDIYSPEEVARLRANTEGYTGFRTAIDASGDWVFAIAGGD